MKRKLISDGLFIVLLLFLGESGSFPAMSGFAETDVSAQNRSAGFRTD